MNDSAPGSIPIIDLWGHLVVPLVGDVSDSQMQRLVDGVLQRVRGRGTRGLVLDCSGLWMMDSHLCAALGKLAAAARLMGVPSVLCGLGPDIVMTLQTMGFDLVGLKAALSLEAALEKLGVVPERRASGEV
jgi:rsbT antagonist protein RsbS